MHATAVSTHTRTLLFLIIIALLVILVTGTAGGEQAVVRGAATATAW